MVKPCVNVLDGVTTNCPDAHYPEILFTLIVCCLVLALLVIGMIVWCYRRRLAFKRAYLAMYEPEAPVFSPEKDNAQIPAANVQVVRNDAPKDVKKKELPPKRYIGDGKGAKSKHSLDEYKSLE